MRFGRARLPPPLHWLLCSARATAAHTPTKKFSCTHPPRTFTWAGVGSGEHRVWVGPHPQQPSGCPHQPSNKTMCCPPPPRPPRCPTRVGSLTHHVRNCVYTHCWMPHATWERREGGQPRVVACCVGGCGGWPPLLDILNSVATPPCHPSPPPLPAPHPWTPLCVEQ